MPDQAPVTLRPIELKDMEHLRSLMNDPEIALSVVDFGFPVSADQQQEWFRFAQPNENAERFMIEAEGVTVGSLVAAKIDDDNLTCEVGYKVDKAHQGHGYAAMAVRAVLPHLFLERGLECVVAYHLPTNMASMHVLAKAGFTFEGTVRQAVYRNGARADLWYWSVTKAQFLKEAGEPNAADR
jgi:ribosomal-protein-alanine N-acetyltransferase